MNKLQSSISWYKALPLWAKILLFVPIVILVILLAIWYFTNSRKQHFSDVLSKHSKQVDNQVETLLDKAEDEEEIREKIDIEIEKIEQEQEEIRENLKKEEEENNYEGMLEEINKPHDGDATSDLLDRLHKGRPY